MNIEDLPQDSNSKTYFFNTCSRVVGNYVYYIIESLKPSNNAKDTRISFYDSMLLIKVNLSTLETEEIPLCVSKDLSTSTTMSNERYVIALTKKWDEEKQEKVSLDNYDNVIIYDCYEETFINDNDYKKYYDDPQYKPKQEETSFTVNDITYNVYGESVVNTLTNEMKTIENVENLIMNCKDITDEDKEKLEFLQENSYRYKFFVINNQLYLCIQETDSMFGMAEMPTLLFKYDITNDTCTFITTISIQSIPLLIF